MALRWIPTNLSDFFDDEFNIPTMPFLNRLGQGLNIYETDDSFVAQAALPGIPENNIDITINDNGVVTITGSNEEREKSEKKYYMSSLSTAYNYSFKLPSWVMMEKEPKSELDNGVLTLTFQKEHPSPPKKIKITPKGRTSKSKEDGKA